MKTTKMLTILFLAGWLMLAAGQAAMATPIGTAFTYQGHLYDVNHAANGLYDFAFKLYNANVAGSKVGTDVNVADVGVIDAYFTVELDFNDANAFNGNGRWLEIGVRPGEQSDPCEYTTLSPRQEVTPTPYAIYAKTAGTGGADSDWTISGVDMYSGVSGNVGIGTPSPDERLTVDGTIKSTTSDADGYAVYAEASNSGDVTNYGGYFEAAGKQGRAVYGKADTVAKATNYGGYFEAMGDYGRGVYGYAATGYGVYGESAGGYGYGVYGKATNSTDAENYGGYFETASKIGCGVYGGSTNSASSTNYGGYFTAAGQTGRAVYGDANNSGDVENYGGYFIAAGEDGRAIYGKATSTKSVNYGGYFEAAGKSAYAVFGAATAIGNVKNYGGGFSAGGDDGVGILAGVSGSDAVGVQALSGGANAFSVQGMAEGSNGVAVYGLALGSNGVGIYGKGLGGSKAGLFEGDVDVAGGVNVTGDVNVVGDVNLAGDVAINGDENVNGNIHAVEEITKAYTAATSNRAIPIAYAFINSNGSVHSGTPNVSCSWNGTNNRYEITIAGESYLVGDYVTAVTATSSTPYIVTNSSASGKLVVYVHDLSGSLTQAAFQFVTFKP